jgi:hypothetical protein
MQTAHERLCDQYPHRVQRAGIYLVLGASTIICNLGRIPNAVTPDVPDEILQDDSDRVVRQAVQLTRMVLDRFVDRQPS